MQNGPGFIANPGPLMRNQKGELNNGSKLTIDVVAKIKGWYQRRLPIWRIAQVTGLPNGNVWCIAKEKSWADVQPNLAVDLPPPPELPTTKLCPRCGQEKPLNLFPQRLISRTGVNSYCKQCKREKSREEHRRVRIKALQLLGGKCTCCGEAQFEFLAIDHHGGGGK